MKIYLDSVICVYAVDGSATFRNLALERLKRLRDAGDQPVISDLVWHECRLKPMREGDALRLVEMEAFLTAGGILRQPISLATFERALELRVRYNFKLADALHLAVAVEHSCQAFLTNDQQLIRCADIAVEIL